MNKMWCLVSFRGYLWFTIPLVLLLLTGGCDTPTPLPTRGTVEREAIVITEPTDAPTPPPTRRAGEPEPTDAPTPPPTVPPPTVGPEPTDTPTPRPTVSPPTGKDLEKVGIYLPEDQSEDKLELTSEGEFYWLLGSQGKEYSGNWTPTGDDISLLAYLVRFRWEMIDDHMLGDAGGESWEKPIAEPGLKGIYLRMNLNQLGDYLELNSDGTLFLELDGAVSQGEWESVGTEIMLAIQIDDTFHLRTVDGSITDSEGRTWNK